MANPEHLAKLKEGVDVWNNWRQENPDIEPDLRDTNLENADLRDANLSGSDLSGSDLFHATLIHTILSFSNLTDTNLSVANLSGADLTCARLTNANFIGAKLIHTNLLESKLIDAKLIGAKLIHTNLIRANILGANLIDANLNRVQALEANFEDVTLTGACIEDWNINSKTNLQNVKCDYIYLKQIYSKEKKTWIYCDRIPHDPDKVFAPGEFTKRYQKILETVNLYFEDGIDWQAFLVSFNKLQVEYDSNKLSINSFENKGNGAFIIKVNVPEGANKAEIEKYLKKQYQLEATVEAQQRELANLYEITKLLAGRSINVNNQASVNTYNQSGNFGIGHNDGNISGNSQVSGLNNEPTQQDSTQNTVNNNND